MTKPNRIFLIGPMGAGKTTIGKQLAQSLGMTFGDSDHEIQRRTGVDIPTIFEYEGEEGFRQREQQAIDDLTQVDNQVLATGGGAILRAENRQHLSARGIVVFLACSPEQQFERTYRDRNRPLLQTEDPLERLKALMAEREPLYLSTADYTVSTEGRSAATVANEILERLHG
ncbi:MAG: shikimate kinase AroK [Chromatiaceae bacterium]|nr:shikimate kinase AroK [Chromatiaceae bacterium]MCP5438144.1 shikimate kinase AroK [Chromatiaceae bacterium]MCW5586012.1 shikimate kinase AroK [Chromatiales bacterium]HOP18251.1 shikimate kinase AroK [Gammaproteobacteria bacterium]HPQ23284.1 shikimate kinase AroK [Gammaproteobacteria bacterium]